MKKRVLAVVLAVALVLAALPVAVSASVSTPTGSGTYFFANGTPITITADQPEDGTDATNTTQFNSFKAKPSEGENPDAYIRWQDSSGTKYIGVSASVVVFGGSNGSTTRVTLEANPRITMSGGTVDRIYAGNLGEDAANDTSGNRSKVSAVIGNPEVTITGGNVTSMIAAGLCNSAVKGTFTLNISNTNSGNTNNTCYVYAGIHGNGHEGIARDLVNKNIESAAVVDNAAVDIRGSNFQAVAAGGGGTTILENVTMTVDGGQIGYMYLGGVNGYTHNSQVTIRQGTIITSELAATNRGFVGNAVANVSATVRGTLYTGATIDCFSTDGNDASAITGSVIWNLQDNASITKAVLTPSVNQTPSGTAYDISVGNQTINKAGTPLTLSAGKFSLGTKAMGVIGSTTISSYNIPTGTSLTLNNASLNVVTQAGSTSPTTLTNNGTLNGNVAVSGTDTALTNNGTLNGSVTASNGAVVTNHNTIDGSVNVGSGSTLTNNAGATITGPAYGSGKVINYGVIDPKVEPITSDLVITRQYDGSSQPVQIRVTLGRILTGSYGGHYFDHGVGVFTLQPGQSLYFHDLPANMTYDVAVLDGLVTAESNMSGTTLPNLTNSMYTTVTFAALPGVTPPDVVPGEEEIIEDEEEIVTPGEEEGDVQEGTEETVPEEGEAPEEGLEELPEEGEVPTEEPVDVPKTGDSVPSVGLALVFGLCACAVVLKKARTR